MLLVSEKVPEGYRLATVHDVTKFQKEARNGITEKWGVVTLEDGRILGSGYGYRVESGSFESEATGHKLVITDNQGNLEEFYMTYKTKIIYIFFNKGAI